MRACGKRGCGRATTEPSSTSTWRCWPTPTHPGSRTRRFLRTVTRRPSQPRCSPRLGGEPDRAGNAGTAEAAVAVRVRREVLLVVRLGGVERPRRCELGRDLPVARASQLRLVGRAGALDLGALLLARPVDRRAVLRADVV